MSHYGTSIKAHVHSLFSFAVSLPQIMLYFYLHVYVSFLLLFLFLFEQRNKYYAVDTIERPWPVEMKITRHSNH